MGSCFERLGQSLEPFAAIHREKAYHSAMAAADPPLEKLELELVHAKTHRTYARMNVGFCATAILYNLVSVVPWSSTSATHVICAMLLVPALAMWLSVLRIRDHRLAQLSLSLERALAERASSSGTYR